MSAWIVSKGHIDALVLGGVQYGLVPADADLTEFGKMLWRENHRSVNCRYDEHTPVPDYRFEPMEVRLDPIGLRKQVGCYDYQTCEHETWEDSEAYAFVRRLGSAIDAELATMGVGEDYYNHPRYDAAPWGVESPLEIAEGGAPAARRQSTRKLRADMVVGSGGYATDVQL